MGVAVEMLQFTAAVGAANQVRRIMVSQDRQGLFELVLFDVAMGGEISAGGTSRDEVFAGQEG